MSFGSSTIGTTPLVYLEVPCIDLAISNRRTVDFYYEHSSQFTTNSFTRMLTLATKEILDIGHDYGGEVVFGFAKLGVSNKSIVLADEAHDFFTDVQGSLDSIRGELEKLISSGKRVAIWGGYRQIRCFHVPLWGGRSTVSLSCGFRL